MGVVGPLGQLRVEVGGRGMLPVETATVLSEGKA